MRKTRTNKQIFGTCWLAVLILILPGGLARGQIYNLNPVAFDGLRELPAGSPPFELGWGYGSLTYGSEAIDETVADFSLSGFSPGAHISSANLVFYMQTQDAGSTPLPISLYTFYGESAIQTSDWNNGVFYQSFADPDGVTTWNITSAVQTAINNGATYFDIRMATTDGGCSVFIAPDWQSPGLSLDITAVPEPSTPQILAWSAGLAYIWFRVRRRPSARCSELVT